MSHSVIWVRVSIISFRYLFSFSFYLSLQTNFAHAADTTFKLLGVLRGQVFMQMFIFNSLELNELNGSQLLVSELSQQQLFYLLTLPDFKQ